MAEIVITTYIFKQDTRITVAKFTKLSSRYLHILFGQTPED